ncbi:MAG: iron-sulfur cluster assembly scaffold protein [Dehalococcoidales bacterium]
MDEQVVKYYRRLCQTGFAHTGSLENPSIFLDTVGEKIRICSHVSHAYMHIYINVRHGTIDDIKYLCTCDPTANVVVEILCALVKGKTIQEAEALTVDSFSQVLGSKGEEFQSKVTGIIELLHRGLARYKTGVHRI